MSRLGQQVARNAVYGGFARFATLLAGLFLTPYLLNRLGEEGFAVWALVGVVTGAFGFFDLSLKAGFVKHLSETLARDDRRGTSAVITTGFVAYLAFSAVAVLAFFFLRDPILWALDIPAALRAEAAGVFAIGLASFLVGATFSVFAAVCDAKQRMDLTHTLGVASLGVTLVATIVAVEKGYGLHGVALAQLLGVTLFFAASILVSRRLIGGLGLDFAAVDRRWFRRLLRFGGILHVSSACGIVNRQLDKLLLSNWAGLPAVASYEVAARLTANTGSFQPYLAAALLPAASHLETLSRRRELVALYLRASRYLLFLGIPPFVFLFVNSRTIMVAWLGRPEPLAAAVLLVLTGGYLVNSVTNGMAFVCQGIDRPDLQARQSAVQLVINVVASVVLLRVVGPLGAPLGTSLALVAGAAVFARWFHPLLGLTTAAVLREAAWIPLLASLAASGAGFMAASWIEAGARAGALAALGLHGLVFTIVYLAVCRGSGFLRAAEIRELLATMRVRRGDGA